MLFNLLEFLLVNKFDHNSQGIISVPVGHTSPCLTPCYMQSDTFSESVFGVLHVAILISYRFPCVISQMKENKFLDKFMIYCLSIDKLLFVHTVHNLAHLLVCTNTHLEKFVSLAELHGLLPAVVALVQVGGDATELNQLVFLQRLGEGDVVKVIKGVDGGAQTLVVFLIDQQVVESIVDGFVVVTLNLWVGKENVS